MITPMIFNALYGFYSSKVIHHVSSENDGYAKIVKVWYYSPDSKTSFIGYHKILEDGLPFIHPFKTEQLDRITILTSEPLPPYGGISAECVAFFEREWLLKAVVSHGYVHYKTESEVTDGEATVTMRLRLLEEELDIG